jgi:predicted regulator of Ras-like GTPase activity (Roadblock/LC7/MglB family)
VVLDDSLQSLRDQVDGVRAVMLVDRDGMVVSAVGESRESLDLIAASYMDLARRVIATHEEGELGAPQDLLVCGAESSVVFRVVARDYGLLAVLGPRGIPGRVRFELRKVSALVWPELES